MVELKIKISEKDRKVLEELAQENATDPETLVYTQITHLIKTYQGKGLTPDLNKHLAASIRENLDLLKRLAR